MRAFYEANIAVLVNFLCDLDHILYSIFNILQKKLQKTTFQTETCHIFQVQYKYKKVYVKV